MKKENLEEVVGTEESIEEITRIARIKQFGKENAGKLVAGAAVVGAAAGAVIYAATRGEGESEDYVVVDGHDGQDF